MKEKKLKIPLFLVSRDLDINFFLFAKHRVRAYKLNVMYTYCVNKPVSSSLLWCRCYVWYKYDEKRKKARKNKRQKATKKKTDPRCALCLFFLILTSVFYTPPRHVCYRIDTEALILTVIAQNRR